MKSNNEGMTVVEVLIALAIISIVIGVTYSIYIGNAKHIGREELEAQLQNEAQIIESTFTQLSMQTSGIQDKVICKKEVNDDKRVYYEVDYLSMKSENKTIESNFTLYEWILNDKVLNLRTNENEYIISKNVTSFKIRSVDIPNDTNKEDGYELNDCKIIEVKIELQKKKGFNDITYPISMIVTFRNK